MRATLLALSLLSCDAGDGRETASTPASSDVAHPPGAQASNGTPSSSSTAAQGRVSASPWFVGRWSGDYTVEKHPVERPSVQIAWMRDDGSRFAGRGTLNFDVDAQGRLLGSGDGALGSQRIVGFLDPEALTFRLEGTPTVDGMSGVVSCGKVASENEAVCSVNATSGDGNFVRAGSARLRQVPPASP